MLSFNLNLNGITVYPVSYSTKIKNLKYIKKIPRKDELKELEGLKNFTKVKIFKD
jgi:hypothetical protein